VGWLGTCCCCCCFPETLTIKGCGQSALCGGPPGAEPHNSLRVA
jgi:hypothetical protein